MEASFYAGKHILITGSTGDLGKALVRRLLDFPVKLILSSKSEEKLDELIKDLPKQAEVIPIASDLSVPGECQKLAEKAVELAGHIDIVFNNAGLGYFALMEEADEEKIRYLYEVNTFAPLFLMKALVPHMIMRGSGRFINIVSSAGRVPIPSVGVYGGSKSALAVMANTMRLELEPKGIDILNIYPGTVSDSFERNAMRESNRSGLCPSDDCGVAEDEIAEKILEAATGLPGEIWLEKGGKWLALAAIAWPGLVDNRLKPLRNRAVNETSMMKPKESRKWRLWQVESTLACNLNCIMCPWEGEREHLTARGHMTQEIWESLVPYLNDVKSVDFTGGGEPLLQKNLLAWITQAKTNGCDVGFLTNGLLLKKSLSEQLIDIGLDWIGFSIDGADKQTYESIRRGSDFDKVCSNIKTLTELKIGRKPLVMINFVIMSNNHHQLEEIIKLASYLKADQVNFKQCDVIRGEHGKGFGLFNPTETKQVKQLQRVFNKASRLARKLNVNVTSFSFLPEEQPVCDQDPRDSVFIRYDGSVAPCINLAIGGPSSFLGEDIEFPTIHYGKLPESDFMDLWYSSQCSFYRKRFQQRVKIHDGVLAAADYGHSLQKLKNAFKSAIDAMPDAPEGCQKCHYLYDI